MVLSNQKIELQKKVKYFIFLLIIVININICFSKDKFIPGYILTVNGDTLKGEILDRGAIINAQIVVFRENENGKEQYLTPIDISAYFISNGNYYESRIFDFYQQIPVKTLQLNANTSKESKTRSAYKIIRDTAFLRIVVKGKARLYIYTNKAGREMYFIETPYRGFKHLKDHKTYSTRKNGAIKFKTKRTILDTLQFIVSDCKEDIFLEKRKKVLMTDMINLLMDYNSCIDSKSEIIQPRKKTKIRFGLNVGWNTTNIDAKEEQISQMEKYDFNPGSGYMIGIIADWYFNNLKEKWAIQTEFCYNQKSADPNNYDVLVHYVGRNGILEPVYDSIRFKIDAEYIDIGLLGKYFFTSSTKAFRPYISGGIILGILMNQEDAVIMERNGKTNFDSWQKLPDTEAGIIGKAGLLINIKKHFGIYTEFRCSYTKYLQNESITNLRTTLYNFTIGVYL